MASYFLGVDGGQSSTTALVSDAYGKVIGMGHGGPCNHVTGEKAYRKFMSVIGDCVEQASSAAGIPKTGLEFTAACLGFSGGADDKVAYTRELIRSERLKVTHDAEIALTGALEGNPGIVIIAGTGSICFGRNAQGKTARAGGWGYVFGDEGGAFDIARRGLRAMLQAEEGWGPLTDLSNRLLEATGASSANALLHRFYADVPRKDVAALAVLVNECADKGDAAAQTILVKAAIKLAWYVEGLHSNLFPKAPAVPIAIIGGVFRSGRVKAAFTERVRAALGCEVVSPKFRPAAGALLEALRLAGNLSSLSEVPEY